MGKRAAAAERDREREREAREAQRRRRLLPLVVPLLLVGLASLVYLLHLYMRVHRADGGPVDSFCAVSDRLNCVTVANSSYSTLLGLPIALYGLEFFTAMLAMVLVSASGAWRVRAWDSLLFVGMLPALPGVAALAWLSSVKIGSVCLLCSAVQASVVLIFLVLLVSGRKRLRAMLVEGPAELAAVLRPRSRMAVAVLLAVAALSQLFWAPPLFRSASVDDATSAWSGLPVSGLTIGARNAPVRIEEFTDFQCPHCGKAHQIMMQVLSRYPGKVFLVHRDFPLDRACNRMVPRPFHPHACRAALYARCAAKQDKYWPYEALLFDNREQLEESNLRALAGRVGMDPHRLDQCLADPATMQAIKADIEDGIRRGLTGTPTLFVNGEMMVGMPPLAAWENIIKRPPRSPGQ